MVSGNQLIRDQTKYRPNQHQKLPSKEPLDAMLAPMFKRYNMRYMRVYMRYDEKR